MYESGFDPPEPPGVRPVNFSPWRWIVLAVFGAILMWAAFNVRIPMYYVYLPGPAPEVEGLIEIDDATTYSSEGSFILTTVSVDTDITFADMVFTALDPDRVVVDADAVTGGESLRDLQREQEAEMRSSNRHAQEVAFEALGLGRPEGDGAEVVTTVRDSPAAEVLKPGDLILAVDGEPVSTACDVGRAINFHEVGETVTVTVRRDGDRKTFELKSIAHPQDPASAFLGIQMNEVNYRFNPGVDVQFETGDIAGPSAGLLFSLTLYDQLTPDDLTGGRKIAGTGTIDCDGGVGPIGGVEQKVAGAEREGAEIFLAPTLNAEPARAVADDIRIVSISNFQDAVDFLEGLD